MYLRFSIQAGILSALHPKKGKKIEDLLLRNLKQIQTVNKSTQDDSFKIELNRQCCKKNI